MGPDRGDIWEEHAPHWPHGEHTTHVKVPKMNAVGVHDAHVKIPKMNAVGGVHQAVSVWTR